MIASLVFTGAASADETPGLSIYGFVRLDAIVNDSPLSDPQAPQYVEIEPEGESDADLTLHPRLTRLGLEIEQFSLGELFEGSGTIEVDFQPDARGTGATDVMRVRHAYFALSSRRLEILAGQTWDLISPLFPAANNDSLMWNAGNTGAWRPQVRVTGTPGQMFRIAVALGMTGAVDQQDLDDNGQLDGFASATPMFQSLIEYRMRLWHGKILRLGLWNHIGAEALSDDTTFTTSSFGGHLLFPLTDRLTLLGELFFGRNLSDIRGGIGHSVNLTTGEEIRALGGWVEAAFVASRRYMIAAGVTFDQPNADDLENARPERNQTIYLVQRYRPWRALQIGVEYIHWRTRYKALGTSVANRFNIHGTLSF